MKKFMKEYSKAVLIVLLCMCAIPILGYESRAFIATITQTAPPDTTIASLALTSGLIGTCFSFAKSFLEKNSLNKNSLRISEDGKVSRIEKE